MERSWLMAMGATSRGTQCTRMRRATTTLVSNHQHKHKHIGKPPHHAVGKTEAPFARAPLPLRGSEWGWRNGPTSTCEFSRGHTTQMHASVSSSATMSKGSTVDPTFKRPARIGHLVKDDRVVDSGEDVQVLGWIRSSRAQKSIAFMDVSDGSCHSGIQVVVDKESAPDAFGRISKGETPTGTAVRITGKLVQSHTGKANNKQSVEIQAQAIEVVGECSGLDYPLQKKRHTLEFLRNIAHLRPRTNTIGAMIRVRSTLMQSTHDFFRMHGFLFVNTPIITQSDCEGAGEAFKVATLQDEDDTAGNAEDANGSGAGEESVEALKAEISAQGDAVKSAKAKAKELGEQPNVYAKEEIARLLSLKASLSELEQEGPASGMGPRSPSKEFFGKEAFLTVSGQLEAEAYACAVRDVYTFGPTFRAENSNTARHLAEFWMVEPELAFAGLDDIISCSQAYIKYCLRRVLDENAEDMDFFSKFVSPGRKELLQALVDSPWHRITYTEAVQALQGEVSEGKTDFQYPVEWGLDLQTEHERYLTEKVFGGRPVYVTDYPKGIKSFYMRLNDDGETVAATDLLVPGIGELIGGSAREERLPLLEEKMQAEGLAETLWWYKDLRKYGSVPHAGFGLGFERLVQLTTGLENIRDVIPFPRYPGHAEF